MAIENCTEALQSVMKAEFDEYCDSSVIRAELFKLSEALSDLRAGLLFGALADQFEMNSMAEVDYLHSLSLLETVAMGIKRSALQIK